MLMWIGVWIGYNQHVASVGVTFILKQKRVISIAILVAKELTTFTRIQKIIANHGVCFVILPLNSCMGLKTV